MSDYPIFEFSKKDIAKAGDRLRAHILWDDYGHDVLETFAIANSWRNSHVLPMKSIRQSVGQRMRHLGLEGDCVSRAKRMVSIRDKLRRHPGKLNQMQDLGGCRAILTDIAGVQSLVANCLEEMPHAVHHHKDYVNKPKQDGYRSHHIIFEFNGEASRSGYDGRRIELQIRTRLQHSWATAVEVVGQSRQESLKSGSGNSDWLKFFKLVSDEFTFLEKCDLDRVASNRKERRKEIRDLNQRLGALGVLENHRSMTRYLSHYVQANRSRVYLIRYDNANHTVAIEGYWDATVAAEALRIEERLIEESGAAHNSAVLVDAKEAKSILDAFPNYFGDVSLFTKQLKEICKIDGTDYVLPSQPLAAKKPHENPDLSWFKQRHRKWFDQKR